MQHRAIETRYKGYRFRSRLEARWAVFFDALGVKWEYEPEGFELPSGPYLPDFKVTYPGDRQRNSEIHWFECKGDLQQVTHDEWVKMLEFERAANLIVLDGTPDCKMYCEPSSLCAELLQVVGGEIRAIDSALDDKRDGWILWSHKQRPWWDSYGNAFLEADGFPDLDRKIPTAARAARGARFEHGERGAACR